MASITGREGSWQAKIRRKGLKTISRTFDTKTKAQEWAKMIEGRIAAGDYTDRKRESETPLSDVLDRYIAEVAITKASYTSIRSRINVHLRPYLGKMAVAMIMPENIAELRDRLVKQGYSASSVSHAMNTLSAVYTMMTTEWGYRVTNPVTAVARPKPAPHREVNLTQDQERRLLEACLCRGSDPRMYYATRIAIATAMRAGEIRRIQRKHIHELYVHLPKTKNGEARDVPLTEEASKLMKEVCAAMPLSEGGYLFGHPDKTAKDGGFTDSSLTSLFSRAADDAKLGHITFHDLRHVATTRLAEFHKDAFDLSLTTGHKTLNILKRYYNPTPEDRATELRERMLDRERLKDIRQQSKKTLSVIK